MKTSLIIGSYGAGNLGDEAMLEVISSYLKERKHTVFALSGNIEDSKKRHPNLDDIGLHFPFGLRSFSSFKWIHSIKLLWKADQVILGGGGLFTDHETIKAPLLWSWQVFWARLFRKRIILLANSVGPFRTKAGRLFSKKALKRCKVLSVRDEISQKEIKKLLPRRKVILGSDIAFLIKEESKPNPKKMLAINMRPWHRALKPLEEFIEKESHNGYHIRLIPTGRGDVKLLNQFKGKSITIDQPKSFNELIKILKNCEVAIGMRLHFLIAACLADCRVGGVSYSSKVKGILKGLKIPFVSIKDINEKELKGLLKRASKPKHILENKKAALRLLKLIE